jgi:acyl-CoA thioesterase-1
MTRLGDGYDFPSDGAMRIASFLRAAMTRAPLVLLFAGLLASCGDAPAREDVGAARRVGRYRGADTSRPPDIDSLAPVSTEGNVIARSNTDSNAARPTILFIGTSLTAGFGIDISQAYPAVVGRMLDSARHPARIINAGVSGETSAGALRRIDWVLRTPADVIVLETGANDGLRGLDPQALRRNIETILARIRSEQPRARVFLVQMEAPPNMGARYTKAFHDLFPEAARASGVELMPFFLDGVAGDPALNQEDGIHPNVRGAQIVGANVTRALLKRRNR